MATPDMTRPGGATNRRGVAGFARRLSTETKHAFKTTEFWTFVAIAIGVLIAGNQIEIEEGGTDYFAADKVWLYIVILASAYMVSRGLAKAGSRDPYWSGGTNQDPDRDTDDRGGAGRLTP
jgi:hypothetical protein